MLDLPRWTKRSIVIALDSISLVAALYLAIALKTDFAQDGFALALGGYVTVLAIAHGVFASLGVYRTVFRFSGTGTWIALVLGATLSASGLVILDVLQRSPLLSPATIAIYWLLSVLSLTMIRAVGRWVLAPRPLRGEPVVIYGAGEAGVRLAKALAEDTHLYPVAFVDDKRSLQGSLVRGVSVVPPGELGEIVRRRGVRRVLLAVPSASRRRRAELLQDLSSMGLHVQSIPRLDDILAGRAQVHEIQDVELADVLGRDQVPPDPALLDGSIRDKSVLVTGAGGSIGSELCRQIVRLRPRRLVLFEMSELALYQLERELRAHMASDAGGGFELVAVLGNAQQRSRLREIMAAFGVQTIYHAAAYKHVPIVEENVVEGIQNNVFSTWHTAEAAREAGVETFVLVSTDKAVNPTNVMGATKRLAEIVLQALPTQSARTRFCMVRFGNVLGSSGSVVPLFQEQIRAGGPVTVTHPEARRYFMTIPEAAQLVLQAGSMARGGEVFVLDMGQLVQIEGLARRMIGLLGLTVRDEKNPEGDIEIAYTGLRPGEKLYEELLISDQVAKTEHPMILRAKEPYPSWEVVSAVLAELHLAASQGDCPRVLEVLHRAVPEYNRQPAIHDLVWNRRPEGQPAADAASAGNVAVLADHRGSRNPAGAG